MRLLVLPLILLPLEKMKERFTPFFFLSLVREQRERESQREREREREVLCVENVRGGGRAVIFDRIEAQKRGLGES